MTTRAFCRVGWHKWVKRRNDEGLRYLLCSRCGKENHNETRVNPGATGV